MHWRHSASGCPDLAVAGFEVAVKTTSGTLAYAWRAAHAAGTRPGKDSIVSHGFLVSAMVPRVVAGGISYRCYSLRAYVRLFKKNENDQK